MKDCSQQHFHIEFNGNIIRVDCFVPEVSSIVQQLFKNFLTGNHDQKALLESYSINKRGSSVTIEMVCDDEVIHTQENGHCVEVVNILMNRVKMDLISPVNNALVLHAGLVSYKGKSILLPGNSGNGKSLTTLGLLSLGCEYHTDEVVLQGVDNHKTTPFARPLMIKPHGVKAARELIGNDIDSFMLQGETINSLPIGALHDFFGTRIEDSYSLHSPPPIQSIVFPCYDANSRGKVTSLSPAETMIELFKNNVAARNLSDLGAGPLKKLARQVKAVKLQYANYGQLPQLFEEIQSKTYSKALA